MQRNRLGSLYLGSALLVSACAAHTLAGQAAQEVTVDSSERWNGRAFVLSVGANSHSFQNGGWESGSRLREYVAAHKGESFLAFEQEGAVYRLDRPAVLRPLAELYQPMEHLSALQQELSASMAPLSAQQAVLASQMRAMHDYASMGRIGREQGAIGKRQGQIGREQGVIGRQQGVLGRALYRNVQDAIDRCLKEKSCGAVAPAVSPPAAPATA